MHTMADANDTTSRHIIIENFNLPFEHRRHFFDPTQKPRLILRIRNLLVTWGFPKQLVKQADIFVFQPSGDIRLELPDHAAARAFLGGAISKPVTTAHGPVTRHKGPLIATIYTPPQPKPKTKPDRQGFEIFDSLRGTTDPMDIIDLTHDDPANTAADATNGEKATGHDPHGKLPMSRQPPTPPTPTTKHATTETQATSGPSGTTGTDFSNAANTTDANTNIAADLPNHDSLQDLSAPAGIPPQASNPTMNAQDNPDAEMKDESAPSLSRTSNDRSPNTSPPRRQRLKTASPAPPSPRTTRHQANLARNRDTNDSDASTDALLGIGL
jgi:hypothetical protein